MMGVMILFFLYFVIKLYTSIIKNIKLNKSINKCLTETLIDLTLLNEKLSNNINKCPLKS